MATEGSCSIMNLGFWEAAGTDVSAPDADAKRSMQTRAVIHFAPIMPRFAVERLLLSAPPAALDDA